jgi:hypothetical protein
MTTIVIFRGAFRETCRNLPLVATLYGANLLFASVIALAFRGFVAGLGNAGSLGPLLNDFDMTLFYDFLRVHGDAVGALWQVVLFMTLLSVAVNAVLSGGILEVLAGGPPFSLPTFLTGCGTFAARFLRLLVLTGVMTALAGIALIAVAGPAIGSLTGNSKSEIPVIKGIAAAAIVSGAVLIVIVMTSDYARVLTVSTESRSVIRSLGASLTFLARNPGGAIGLQIMLGSVLVCLTGLFLLVAGSLEMNSGWRVFLMFIVQQAFIWCRSFLRVMLYSCDLAYTRSRRAVGGPAEIGIA